MNTFKLTIASPDGNKFSGNAVKLDVRGTEGELAVMAGHIPFITSVVPCKCKLERENDDLFGTIEGGILTVSEDKVTLLAGSFKFVEE